MKNKIQDLRNHLFETIEMLKDGDENKMTVEKAKAIAGVAAVIIESAKTEIQFIKAVTENGTMANNLGTGFLENGTGEKKETKRLK